MICIGVTYEPGKHLYDRKKVEKEKKREMVHTYGSIFKIEKEQRERERERIGMHADSRNILVECSLKMSI